MSKFCKKCGRELNDEAKFCTQCGQPCSKEGDAHVEETSQEHRKTEEQESDQKPDKKSSKWKIPLIIAACILCAACVGYFVIYPQVTAHIEQQKNEEAAVKAKIKLSDYFGDVNNVYMELYRQDEGYYLMFQGPKPRGRGMYCSMEGFVMPNSDKTGFYYVQGHYGQGDPEDWNG